MNRFALLAGWTLLWGVGCATTPAPILVADSAPVEEVDRGPSYSESEIGGMSQEDVAETFQRLMPGIERCVQRRGGDMEQMGGSVGLSVRVDRQGRTRWAYVSASTLGHRETERCMLELAREATWPKPLGGEGLANHTFQIDPGKEPVLIEAKRARASVERATQKLSRCRKGQKGAFVATAYVKPDGRVLSAGASAPSADGEEAADCIAETLSKLHFFSPGRRVGKITFELPDPG